MVPKIVDQLSKVVEFDNVAILQSHLQSIQDLRSGIHGIESFKSDLDGYQNGKLGLN